MSISLFSGLAESFASQPPPVASIAAQRRTEPFLGFYCFDRGLAVTLRPSQGRTQPLVEVVHQPAEGRERILARLVGKDCEQQARRFCERQGHTVQPAKPIQPTTAFPTP